MAKAETTKMLVKDVVVPGLKAFLSGHVEDSVSRIKKAAHDAEKDIEHRIATGSLFVFGMILFLVGIGLLLPEYTGLSLGWSYLILGFSLIFMSMIFMILRK